MRDYCTFADRELQTADFLNKIIEQGYIGDYIRVTEAVQEKNLVVIAEEIASRPETKVVMLAGPSSSGKTSTSKRLCIQLMACRKHPVALSMDNWFVNRDKTPLDEFGQKDYESIYAMDLEQFAADVSALIAGQEVELPTFNFQLGQREYLGDRLQLTDDMLLVIEGIHALNPLMSQGIPAESVYRIYAAPLTPISLEAGQWVPTTANRLLRRMCRDYATRGKTAEATIAGWASVRRGEEKWILPFQKEADALFDTSVSYELAALKPLATRLLQQVPLHSPERKEADALLLFLESFVAIDDKDIPRNSLLREFIGGSAFNVG